MIRYVIVATNIPDREQVINLLRREVNEMAATQAKSVYEQLIYEGVEKGIEKGEQRSQSKIAINLLRHSMSLQEVAKLTGLSFEEVENLRKKLH